MTTTWQTYRPTSFVAYLRNMLTPLWINCFWMAFHDCTKTMTSFSVRGCTGISVGCSSSGPAPLKLLDLTTSWMLDRWCCFDFWQLTTDEALDAGRHRRNGLDASSHVKQHILRLHRRHSQLRAYRITACCWRRTCLAAENRGAARPLLVHCRRNVGLQETTHLADRRTQCSPILSATEDDYSSYSATSLNGTGKNRVPTQTPIACNWWWCCGGQHRLLILQRMSMASDALSCDFDVTNSSSSSSSSHMSPGAFIQLKTNYVRPDTTRLVAVFLVGYRLIRYRRYAKFYENVTRKVG